MSLPDTSCSVAPEFDQLFLALLVCMLAELLNQEGQHLWLPTKQILNFVKWCVVRMLFLLEHSADEEDRAIPCHNCHELWEGFQGQFVVNDELCSGFGVLRLG